MTIIYDLTTYEILGFCTNPDKVRQKLRNKIIPIRSANLGEPRKPVPVDCDPPDLPNDWPRFEWSDPIAQVGTINVENWPLAVKIRTAPNCGIFVNPDGVIEGIAVPGDRVYAIEDLLIVHHSPPEG